MIGELRLKVDGMQKELHTQNKRLEEGARFAEHFHNDLRVAVQVLGYNIRATMQQQYEQNHRLLGIVYAEYEIERR